jgi:hypothetical protein
LANKREVKVTWTSNGALPGRVQFSGLHNDGVFIASLFQWERFADAARAIGAQLGEPVVEWRRPNELSKAQIVSLYETKQETNRQMLLEKLGAIATNVRMLKQLFSEHAGMPP